MAKTKTKKHQPVANPAYAEGMREIRRSNAAGSHDNRPNRQRTRKDAKRAAMRDWR